MKLGRAYKLAALAARHKAKAIVLLEKGDHEGARKEEIEYLDCVENIPSKHRLEVGPFLDASLQAKLTSMAKERSNGSGKHSA
ncbi:MAG TPA: hypothetical protein VN989_01150 [Casimicrobiaceae bacterium]|jgi:hypothetical protein|nr:hypothetical protein [Casimicrobiaceae bacterium]